MQTRDSEKKQQQQRENFIADKAELYQHFAGYIQLLAGHDEDLKQNLIVHLFELHESNLCISQPYVITSLKHYKINQFKSFCRTDNKIWKPTFDLCSMDEEDEEEWIGAAIYHQTEITRAQAEPNYRPGCAILYSLIDCLPKAQRKIIILHYFGKYSIEAVAELMGISRQCANQQKIKALFKLKKLFLEKKITNLFESEMH